MEEWLLERYGLAKNRISEIRTEENTDERFRDFFQKMAELFTDAAVVLERESEEDSLAKLQEENHRFYDDVLPENYETCYGNPVYAVQKSGEYGKAFSFLYNELRGVVPFAYEKDYEEYTILAELLLEVYSAFENHEIPEVSNVENILRSYVNDYCQDMVEKRIAEAVDPGRDFAVRIIMDSDLSDIRYLYRFGEYITENETGVAQFLNSLSKKEIESMARTFTEGYRIGFIATGKDLRKKKTVNIRYKLGFERMVREAVRQFEEMGLKPVIYRHALHAVSKKGYRSGYTGGVANPQFDFDHKQDDALFIDQDFVKRKLRAMQTSYEKYKDLANLHAGPACIETFGQELFSPVSKPEAMRLTESQQKLNVDMDNEAGQIVNRYIRGDERSFTIIAYPVPEIGTAFPEIFRETVKINTLDYKLYQRLQQTIIDTLDTCEWVEIKGRDDNETDMLVHLHTLENPAKQTNFENCVADVNIPVGEVFTSPVLAGTGGVLHVKKIYLHGVLFKDLKLVFDCGQVIDYSCANFETEEENRKYIEDNILFHHNKLPIGEFAIGTNTTAYVAGKKYGIADKFPVLIAEKTGPHFAVGDTCYSWAEDTAVYNPDGKEIIARDNEISILRKEDLSLAYYGCHTDITIPYDELGSIRVIDDDGESISIIENGRFVLPGTEELNKPLDEQL